MAFQRQLEPLDVVPGLTVSMGLVNAQLPVLQGFVFIQFIMQKNKGVYAEPRIPEVKKLFAEVESQLAFKADGPVGETLEGTCARVEGVKAALEPYVGEIGTALKKKVCSPEGQVPVTTDMDGTTDMRNTVLEADFGLVVD